MSQPYDVLLDGQPVTQRVVAFDPLEGWVDVYEETKGGEIRIDDDYKPVMKRLTGVVTVRPNMPA